MNQKIGRNDPCTCGSGKKYKACCLEHQKPATKKTLLGRCKIVAAKPALQPTTGVNLMERAFGDKISGDTSFHQVSDSKESNT